MLVGYLFNTCAPMPAFQYENHHYCDGIGTRILYICVDDDGYFVEFVSTCSSSIEGSGEEVDLVFLPLITVGGE